MSRKIAFGGIFAAIVTILVYFAAISPSGKLVLYSLSSLPIAFMLIEFGAAAALSLYAVSFMLLYILTGNIVSILPFVLFFGLYAIEKYHIEKVRNGYLEIFLKLAVFNLTLFIAYFVYNGIGFSLGAIGENKNWLALFYIALQLAYFAYDYVFTRIVILYEEKFRFYSNGK